MAEAYHLGDMLLVLGDAGFVRVFKTLEFQKSDCKALKVLEIDFVLESP